MIAPFLRRVLILSAQFPRIRTCSGQIHLYRGEIAVYGLVVVCRNIHDVEKVLNSSAVNCGPLSVTSSSAMP